MIALGHYELQETLGRGGMGQVWRARDLMTDREVAVKLITGDSAAQPEYRRRFRAEVQSMARLDHPNIVDVFDYGRLDAEVASALDSPVGAPFYVMELAHGTLLDVEMENWASIRRMLGLVLDALAHSHSRGVIHRDLKPGNILTHGDGYRLADFGIAYHSHQWAKDLTFARGGDGELVGSPQYMAPEQWLGHWRDYGSWTDLYALGCLTFELVCGKRPFEGGSVMALAIAHTTEDRATFEPRFPTPPGLEDWFDWILARNPRKRFRRAADAAWALAQLPPVQGEAARTLPGLGLDQATVILPTRTSVLDELVGEFEETSSFETAPAVPGVAEQWRRPSAKKSRVRGLGLLGLRAPAMVDRDHARDVLWAALREAASTGRPRGLVLEGPAGVGKSRLAQWLCECADEQGGAKSMRVAHAPSGQFADGIAPTLDTAFSTHQLNGTELFGRVEQALRALAPTAAIADVLAADTQLVAELIRPSNEGFDITRAQRDTTLTRLMKALGAQRALVFWVDDAQWANDTLTLAETLLRHDRRLPVLVVLTVRSDVASWSTGIADTLQRILDLENVSKLDIGPLAPDDQRALVDDLLPLSEPLAQAVVDQTRGEPLFAVQIMQSLAESDALARGVVHYDLRTARSLPVDVFAACSARIEHLLTSFADESADARSALEYAAALGEHIDEREWTAICEEQGNTSAARLLDEMVSMGIAMPREGAWAFSHHTFRDVVERNTSPDRRRRVQNDWAEFLDRNYDRTRYGIPGRVAEHRLAAGERAAALEPLLEAAAQHYARAEYLDALRLLETRQAALDELRLPATDRRQAENRVLRFWYSLNRGEVLHDEVAALATGERFAVENGWTDLAARQAHLQGYIALLGARESEAEEHLIRATQLAEVASDHVLAGHARRLRGFLAMRVGDFDTATELVDSALVIFRQIGQDAGVAESRRTLATISSERGDFDMAEAQLRHALRELAGTGLRDQRALLLNDLGEVLCCLEQFDAAQRSLEEARLLFQHCGMSMFLPEGNLGTVLLERGECAAAQSLLASAVEGARAAGHATVALMFHVGLDAADVMVNGEAPPGVDDRLAELAALESHDQSAGWSLRLLRRAAQTAGLTDLADAANTVLQRVLRV